MEGKQFLGYRNAFSRSALLELEAELHCFCELSCNANVQFRKKM
jgi:hypothetical protein